MQHRVGGWVAGWPGGRAVDTYINQPFPGPTCKLEPARSKRVGFQVGTECGNNIEDIKCLRDAKDTRDRNHMKDIYDLNDSSFFQ